MSWCHLTGAIIRLPSRQSARHTGFYFITFCPGTIILTQVSPHKKTAKHAVTFSHTTVTLLRDQYRGHYTNIIVLCRRGSFIQALTISSFLIKLRTETGRRTDSWPAGTLSCPPPLLIVVHDRKRLLWPIIVEGQMEFHLRTSVSLSRPCRDLGVPLMPPVASASNHHNMHVCNRSDIISQCWHRAKSHSYRPRGVCVMASREWLITQR